MPVDIVLLQDTHLTESSVSCFNTLWKGKLYHSCGTFNSRGPSILIGSKVSHEVLALKSCPDGNFMILVCKIHTNVYTIVSIYGPNEDKPSFYEALSEYLEELPNDNLIIGGDLNFVIDYKRDSNYVRDNNVNAKRSFLNLVNKYNLEDVWRYFHPNEKQFTWLKQNPLKFGRLDMFFASDHLIN